MIIVLVSVIAQCKRTGHENSGAATKRNASHFVLNGLAYPVVDESFLCIWYIRSWKYFCMIAEQIAHFCWCCIIVYKLSACECCIRVGFTRVVRLGKRLRFSCARIVWSVPCFSSHQCDLFMTRLKSFRLMGLGDYFTVIQQRSVIGKVGTSLSNCYCCRADD